MTPARLIVVPAALWHSGEAKIAACSLRSATVPTGAALRWSLRRGFSFAHPSLLHRSCATSTRQGFDTAIGMRPISLPDALVIEIQNPSRLPSYAISSARVSRQGVFVRREFHSVIVVVGTSVANHLKSIPHVGPPIVVRPSRIPLLQLGQVVCGFLVANKCAEEAG